VQPQHFSTDFFPYWCSLMFNRHRKSVDSTLRTLQNEVTALRNEAHQRDADVATLRTQLHALDSRRSC
jgi:hypothetical protein